MKFFNHPEGYVEPNGPSWKYVYQCKDHLGNVRLSYADENGNGSVNSSEIREENNYYPFGLKHRGYNDGISAFNNGVASRWKFGGKEYNEELGLDWYDVHARNYQPDLGRWMNLDPLAEQFPSYSPYNYAMNNPVIYIDIDGRAPNPVLLKAVQIAIQNNAVYSAVTRINNAVEAITGGRPLNKPIISTIPSGNESLTFKGGVVNALLGRNEVNFNGDITLSGQSFNVFGSFDKKVGDSYHAIEEVRVLGSGDNRYTSYTSGFAGGYIVELNGGDETVIRLSFPDAQTHEVFENLLNDAANQYLDELIADNPQLSELFELAEMGAEVQSLFESFSADNPFDSDSEQGRTYLNRRSEFIRQRNRYINNNSREAKEFFRNLANQVNEQLEKNRKQ